MKERLRNAENALATYKAQNNFVGTQDTLISDQQLSASNQRLATARALTLDAQAKYDQIEASRRVAADNGAIPEALQSPTIANLRAQYAEARKRYAELAGELGPLHPSLRQMEKQVEDLRRTVNEEVDRFATSAKNDLTRARDYEASLNKSLDAQKRQSVQMSQASVRLRELERDVEASRDVYQAFLKRSRETEEQESLNTSSARIIGEATIPQRRTFPPAMSLFGDDRFHARHARRSRLDRGRSPLVARRDRTTASPIRDQVSCPAGKYPAAIAGRGGADRKAADRTPAGIRRDTDAGRNPGQRRDCRCHPNGLADVAHGFAADGLSERHARGARGARAAFGCGPDTGYGRDRRGHRGTSQHRRA